MAIFRPNLNTPIPNNPFYSPQTNTLQSATGSLIMGSGITVDYTTGIITVAGGSGSGTVTSVATGTGLTGGPITSSGTISLTNTTVTPGTYNYSTITVDAQGRLTAASSGAAPLTNAIGTPPISVTGTTVKTISIASASTTTPGAVQLFNGTNSTSTALALTAAQGKSLQDQISALLFASNLVLAGTFDATVGVMLTVTNDGTTAGFTVGLNLPAPSAATDNHFVIVTTGGTYDPPGATGPFTLTPGDWLLSSTTEWSLLDVGATFAYATTTTAGTVCLSTNALAQAGADTLTALTPAAARSAYVPNVCYANLGDLVGGSATPNTPLALPIGAAGQILTVDSTSATGFDWKTPATAGTVTTISTGVGLFGGPITSIGTISLTDTAVVPGSYTLANVTVDAQGRITAASSGTPPPGGTVTTVNTGVGLTGGPITSTGTVSLANTAVTAGAYTFGSFTVDAQGRLTAAASGTPPVAAVTGTAPIAVTSGTSPVVSIAASSTTGSGAVQLYNNTDSISTTLALTAAQGYSLQQQIDALLIASNLTLAGTFDAAAAQALTVTSDGTSQGFVVGSNLPSPAAGNTDYFVIVTVPGTYDPPGATGPFTVTTGDWLLSTGTEWSLLDIGPTLLYATTTTAGAVCLSTDALAQAGTDTLTALTPAAAASAYIPKTCVTAKGDLITGTAASTPTALTVGTDGQTLVACAACTSGLTWVTTILPITSATPTVAGIVLGCTTASSTALGCNAALSVSGSGNVAIGNCALCNATIATGNVAIGSQALLVATGSQNVALGTSALAGVVAGVDNLGLGTGAGTNITTGNLNVIIGPGTQAASASGSCQLALGFSSTDNWLTGDSGKNIRPGAGIRDCAGNLGTSGQVLCSTGSAVQWSSVAVNDTAIGICDQGVYLAFDDFEYALWNGTCKSFVIRNRSGSTKYPGWTVFSCNATVNSCASFGVPQWTLTPGAVKYLHEGLGLITFNASQTALISVYAAPFSPAGPVLCVYCFTGVVGDTFSNNWMCIERLY